MPCLPERLFIIRGPLFPWTSALRSLADFLMQMSDSNHVFAFLAKSLSFYSTIVDL